MVSQPLAASQLLPVSQPAMHQPLIVERPLSIHKQSERQTRHHTKALAVSQTVTVSQPLAASHPWPLIQSQTVSQPLAASHPWPLIQSLAGGI